jgi:hypothetical protein
MSKMIDKATWDAFVESETEALTPLLQQLGYTLDSEQPHVSGERYLMSGRKVVLVGQEVRTGESVIIKSSADPTAIEEIEAERTARRTLAKLPFTYQPLLAPRELAYYRQAGRVLVIIEFITQPEPFLSLPLREQFDLVISAFDMLSSAHAATSRHIHHVKRIFERWQATDYWHHLKTFSTALEGCEAFAPRLSDVLTEVRTEMQSTQDDIERYCGFLTHDDFALHNFRFRDGAVYLIDQSSLRFGNKHESWARLLNYFILYNRDLERAILRHVELNLSDEEARSLRLMRMYKLTELLTYHCHAAHTSSGDDRTLSQARVSFWTDVLSSILAGTDVPEERIKEYKTLRDGLRSPEEKARQLAIQQLAE